MKLYSATRQSCWLLVIGSMLLLAASIQARTFTSTDGRTIEAKVLKVNRNSAILERNDGRSVTVPLKLLSPGDREFLAIWAKEDAKNRLPRVKVVVDSNKRDSSIRAGYDERRGSFQFKISITNEERDFKIEKATATLVVLGDYLYTPGESVVMQRAEFKDITFDFGKTYVMNGKEVRYEYYRGYTSGQKYSGYVFVLRNSTGKVINISGSTSRLENVADIILRLNEGDHCNRRYQKIGEGGSDSPAVLR